MNNTSELQTVDECSIPSTSTKTKANCIRHVENWSVIKPHHIFDSDSFDEYQTNYELSIISPKLRKLLDKIKELDEIDRNRTIDDNEMDDDDKKLFKHFIFTDLQGHGHGSKIMASALMAEGYEPIFRKTPGEGIQFKTDIDPFNTFGLLSSTCVYGRPFEERTKKKMLEIFNDRRNNVNGRNVRIIIMDSKFKEGIDLFDVKYVHIFEEPKTISDRKQTIGRATRFCGQSGLNFVENIGWKLNVYIYKLTGLEEYYKQLTINVNGKSIDEGVFMENIEKLSMLSALDYQLNLEMHNKKRDVEMQEQSPYDIEKDVDELTGLMRNIKIEEEELLNMPLEKLQQYIGNTYKHLKYTPVIVKNACKNGQEKIISLSNTQKFVSTYLRPESKQKGMLLWHSVGTGKTCTAIAIKSNFEMNEKKPFHVLWVTKKSLVREERKNMFEFVCHAYIRDIIKEKIKNKELVPTKEKLEELYKEKIKKNLVIDTITYRQFSNALSSGNEWGEKLQRINGRDDIIKNTLIIIDEAHRLYSNDFSETEKPNVEVITQKIHHSYRISNEASCKVLLMTATPMAGSIYNFVNLMNLIIEDPNRRFDEKKFANMMCEHVNAVSWGLKLDCNTLSETGKKYFKERVKGLISYLDRSSDASVFAQPSIETILVEMSRVPTERTSEACSAQVNIDFDKCKNAIHTTFDDQKNTVYDNIEVQSIQLRNIKRKIKENTKNINKLDQQLTIDNVSDKIFGKTKITELERTINNNKLKISVLERDIRNRKNGITATESLDVVDGGAGPIPKTITECELAIEKYHELMAMRTEAFNKKITINHENTDINGKLLKGPNTQKLDAYIKNLNKKLITLTSKLKTTCEKRKVKTTIPPPTPDTTMVSNLPKRLSTIYVQETKDLSPTIPTQKTNELSPTNSAQEKKGKKRNLKELIDYQQGREDSKKTTKPPVIVYNQPTKPLARVYKQPTKPLARVYKQPTKPLARVSVPVEDMVLDRQNDNDNIQTYITEQNQAIIELNNLNDGLNEQIYKIKENNEYENRDEFTKRDLLYENVQLKQHYNDLKTYISEYIKINKIPPPGFEQCKLLQDFGKKNCQKQIKENEIYQDVQIQKCLSNKQLLGGTIYKMKKTDKDMKKKIGGMKNTDKDMKKKIGEMKKTDKELKKKIGEMKNTDKDMKKKIGGMKTDKELKNTDKRYEKRR